MIRIWGGVGLCIQEGLISVWVCIYGVRAQDRFIEAVDTSLDHLVGGGTLCGASCVALWHIHFLRELQIYTSFSLRLISQF